MGESGCPRSLRLGGDGPEVGSLPISQCPCHPEEEGREQHGDPWSPVRGL